MCSATIIRINATGRRVYGSASARRLTIAINPLQSPLTLILDACLSKPQETGEFRAARVGSTCSATAPARGPPLIQRQYFTQRPVLTLA
jgi:hypothetical protein